MPKVPIQEQFISQDGSVTRPSNAGLGIEAQAFGQLGEVVAGLGQDILRHDAAGQAHGALIQDQIDIETKRAELNKQYPTGFVTDESGLPQIDEDTQAPLTTSKAFHQWASERYKDNQGRFTSGLAQEMYRERADSAFAGAFTAIQHDQLVGQNENFKNELSSAAQKKSNFLLNNVEAKTSPGQVDLGSYYSYQDDLSVSLMEASGGATNSVEAESIKKKLLNLNAEATTKGLINSIFYTNKITGKMPSPLESRIAAQNVLDILRNKDPDSQRRAGSKLDTLADALTSDQISSFERQVLSHIASLNGGSGKHARAEVDAYKTARKEGLPADPNAALAAIASTKDSFTKSDLMGTFVEAHVLGYIKDNGELAEASPGLRQALKVGIKEQINKDIIDYAAKIGISKNIAADSTKKAEDALDGAIKALDEKETLKLSDFMADDLKRSAASQLKSNWNPVDPNSTRDLSPILKRHWEEINFRATVSGLNPEQKRPLTEDKAKDLARVFTSKTELSNDQKAMLAESMHQYMPKPMYTAAMAQLIKDHGKDGITEDYRFLRLVNTTAGAKVIIEALNNKEDDVNQLLMSSGKTFVDVQKFGDDVNFEFQSYTQARAKESYGNPLTTDKINFLTRAARVHAKLMVAAGSSQQNAINSAKRYFIDDQGTILRHERGVGGDSAFFVPKDVQASDHPAIQSNLQYLARPESLRSLGVEVRQGVKDVNKYYSGLADTFYPHLAPDGTGVLFSHQDGEDGLPINAWAVPLRWKPPGKYPQPDRQQSPEVMYFSWEQLRQKDYIKNIISNMSQVK